MDKNKLIIIGVVSVVSLSAIGYYIYSKKTTVTKKTTATTGGTTTTTASNTSSTVKQFDPKAFLQGTWTEEFTDVSNANNKHSQTITISGNVFKDPAYSYNLSNIVYDANYNNITFDVTRTDGVVVPSISLYPNQVFNTATGTEGNSILKWTKIK